MLVDNGGTEGWSTGLAATTGVKVIDPGAQPRASPLAATSASPHAGGRGRALVNPDAIVEPDRPRRLAGWRAGPGSASPPPACGWPTDPDLLNSAGNDDPLPRRELVGRFEEPAADHAVARPVFAASGGALDVCRELWNDLGGFDADFFGYYEDAELSLRCMAAGPRGRRTYPTPSCPPLRVLAQPSSTTCSSATA